MQAKTLKPSGALGFTAVAAAVLALLLTCAMMLQPAAAFADDEASASASASESASAPTETPTPAELADAAAGKPLGGIPLMGNDYVWFGRNLELGSCKIDNDLLAAGQIVNISNCSMPGSTRIAAQNATIKGTTAGQNITAAAEIVDIKDSTANAVAAAARTVSFSGTCNELTAYGEKVFIDGTVNGDVKVGANTVEIGTNARIKGTLHVEAASDPVMQRGSEVADVDFKQSNSRASASDVEGALAGASAMLVMMLTIIGLVGTFVVAILAEWLFKRHTAAAAGMMRSRTGAMIGTGIIGALAAPIAIIILMSLGITLPVAGAAAFALFAMTCVAGGFMGASLFKLAFPRLSRFKCAMAGGAIMAVAGAIPFLGSLVHAAAFMYLLGYVLQSIYLGMREPDPVIPNYTYNRPVEPTEGPTPGYPVPPAPPAGAAAPLNNAAPVAPSTPAAPYAPVTPATKTAPIPPDRYTPPTNPTTPLQ